MAAKANKRGSRKQTKKKNTETGFVGIEIVIWVTLAVSVLMMISNFGFGGFIGEAIAGNLAEFFGWAAYVIPIVLFWAVTFLISNRGNPNAYLKVAASLCMVVLSCTFLELIDDGGGRLGQSLAGMLTPAIGVAGTYVVAVTFMIICLVIITGKSALKGVKSQSGKVYDRARRDAARRREQAQERRQIRETQMLDGDGGKPRARRRASLLTRRTRRSLRT